MLEALLPARAAKAALDSPPQRAILISNNLGVLPKPFFPVGTGRDYQLSPYLETLAAHRGDFTVISGLSHPNVRGGHSTENCFLTAARNPTASGFRNTISLDQFAAERIGHLTRFPTLNLGVNIRVGAPADGHRIGRLRFEHWCARGHGRIMQHSARNGSR
jgi:hypothetical protein